MSAWSDRIRWGVIEEARGRQRRWRRLGLAAALVAIAVSVVALAVTGGGGQARFAIPQPGRATGSLRALAVSDYAFWVTPGLDAGNATLDIRVTGLGAQWGMTGCCNGSPGQGSIVGISGPDSVPAPVTFNELPDDVLLVSARVAAVRVGGFGTVGALSVSGLQPGEKVVAFRVPQYVANTRPIRVRLAVPNPHNRAVFLRPPAPERLAPLTALDENGYPLPAVSAAATATEPSTVHGGACAISSALPGLVHEALRAVTMIKPIPASASGIFLSCVNEIVAYQGANPDAVNAQVALLVNAHHPGQLPAPLWGATPVPGHPGIVELKPPHQFGFNIDTGAPMFARRVSNAWLVIAGRPAIPPAPSAAQRIQILDSIHITKLDFNHG
jgi:hypothetical protein